VYLDLHNGREIKIRVEAKCRTTKAGVCCPKVRITPVGRPRPKKSTKGKAKASKKRAAKKKVAAKRR
jgi:hypothetical protein